MQFYIYTYIYIYICIYFYTYVYISIYISASPVWFWPTLSITNVAEDSMIQMWQTWPRKLLLAVARHPAGSAFDAGGAS